MTVSEKVLFGSDFHIPYHNVRYMNLWMKVMKSFKPDTVAILGDLDDAKFSYQNIQMVCQKK